ncbi:DUF4007 family protein [Geopsychrobacter electrodiphilus]|uniref:DUF4007 family protein n=1 Tax=Geopsychrobacter electrodiphilus TaxID=225196 RepID=UPI0003626B4C|nr:DUF4007 family protein [Geopsychrobacter electrodiphilus]
MRFGGHETFAIREGWLHKGLKLLICDPEKLIDEYAADWLGVGRNMAKSINHWLVATGLAKLQVGRKTRKTPLEATQLGELVYERDPFFSEVGTWWILHINLVRSPENALSWEWFFNRFNQVRFEKSFCVDSLKRYLQLSGQRMPSLNTLERDISCMLSTYARKIPVDQGDPEESNVSPFADLHLLKFFRDTGTYQLNQEVKNIPPDILGYSLACAFSEGQLGAKQVDVTIKEATAQAGGPGRVFSLTAEALFDVALSVEKSLDGTGIEIVGLAGERAIRFEKKSPVIWLAQYYDSQGSEEVSTEFFTMLKELRVIL